MEMVEFIIKLLITSLWIPLFVNIVITGTYGRKRAICTVLLILFYIIIGGIGGGTEILTVIFMLLSIVTVYLTMGHSVWKMLSIPAGYMVGVLCDYSIEIVWDSIVVTNADSVVYCVIKHFIMTCMIIVVSFIICFLVKYCY